MHCRAFIIPEIPELLKRVADLETQVAALEYLVYEDNEANEPLARTVSFTVDVPDVKNMSEEEIAEFSRKVAYNIGYEMRRVSHELFEDGVTHTKNKPHIHGFEPTENKRQPELIRQLERIADTLEKLGRQNYVRLSGVICEASEVPIPPHTGSMSLRD